MDKESERKQKMIQSMAASNCIITQACQESGIPRSAHYKWMDEDYDYAKAVEDLTNATVDFVESQLFKQIKDGNTTAIIFYLKTKGKKRGYSQQAEPDNKPQNLRKVKNF